MEDLIVSDVVIENEDPIVSDVIIENRIDSGGGGNYLPLTGGILTGPLGFSGESDFGTTGTTLPIFRFHVMSPDGSVLEKTISVSPNRFIFFDGLEFNGVRSIYPVAGTSCYLGGVDETWKFLFVNKIRNGSGGVLDVPTDGGTIARTEDIDKAVGDISTALTAILGE